MNASATLSCPMTTNLWPVSRRRRAVAVAVAAAATKKYNNTLLRARGSMQTASAAGSFYEILRVETTASFNEIKTAYRSLAKIYHPDATGPSSDGHEFIQIRDAYATLSDPTARAMYDMWLGQRGRRVFPTRRWETDQCW